MLNISYYLKKPFSLFRDIFFYATPRLESMDYSGYWLTRGESTYTRRYSLFSELIEPGSSLFDIGCGDGCAIRHLTEERGVSGEGVDLSAPAVEIAVRKGTKASVADITAPDFRITGTYDYILISEVIEHIGKPEDLVRKTKGHFRKGLIISIPNTGHYIHRLRLLFGRFPVQWMIHPGEHLRFWTLRDFKKWADWLGFEIVAHKSNTGFIGLYHLFPGLFADNLVFLLREKTGRKHIP